jgi:hypothetical protein
MIYLGGSDEGLAGNTPVVEAITSQQILLFYEKCLGTELGGSGSDGETCGSRPYHTHIKIIIGHHYLLILRQTVSNS